MLKSLTFAAVAALSAVCVSCSSLGMRTPASTHACDELIIKPTELAGCSFSSIKVVGDPIVALRTQLSAEECRPIREFLDQINYQAIDLVSGDSFLARTLSNLPIDPTTDPRVKRFIQEAKVEYVECNEIVHTASPRDPSLPQ